MSSPAPEITLSARNLTRCFGGQQIIHQVSLELRCGEVLGLLGQNGAGKSTTMQMLTGCLLPDNAGQNECSIDICGISLLHHPVKARKHIGYLPETPPLYRELSVNDYLTFAARLRGISPAGLAGALTQAKQRCGLERVGHTIIGNLSKGYQQRVGIAQAIIHSPAVIVLDEPTVGLDPMQIRDIRNLIRELGDAHSVLLSTHLLGEVENVCDRVVILHQGRLIYSGSSADMQQYGNGKMKLEEVFLKITEEHGVATQNNAHLPDNKNSVRAELDVTTSHSTKPASGQVAGYVEAHSSSPSTSSGRTGEAP